MACRLQSAAGVLDHRRTPGADRAESAPARGLHATDGAPASALRALADTELRLDQLIAAAREAAAAAVADARRRAEVAAAAVDGEIARVRGEIAAEIAAATDRQLAAIAEQARAEAARFAAVRGAPLDAIAGTLVQRLAAIAFDEGP
jgi:vacuolar-type H+-ATPase subunit H